MAGQKEVIQPNNMAEVWQDVAKPGDQPTESEDCTHLSPENPKQENAQHLRAEIYQIKSHTLESGTKI